MLMLTEKIPSISALAHEMQKERGLSAGFIASKGQKFASELATQRQLTDVILADFRNTAQMAKQMDMAPEIVAQLNLALNNFAQLQSMRAQISALQVKYGDMASYYTNTISEVLMIVERQISSVRNSKMVKELRALNSLLQAKERAGIERAVGAEAFSAGAITSPEYLKFVGLVKLQDYLIGEFNGSASASLVARYQQTVTGSIIDQVQTYRDILIKAPFGGSMASVTGEQDEKCRLAGVAGERCCQRPYSCPDIFSGLCGRAFDNQAG